MAGAVASGCLLGAALPPFDLQPLGWIALVPVLFMSIEASALIGFISGLITALTPAFLLGQRIVPTPHSLVGDPSWIFGGFMIFGMLIAVVCAILGDGKAFGLRKTAILAALAVCLEFATNVLLPVNLALTEWRFAPALAMASVTGIWGVSYVLWFFNCGLATALKSRKRLWLFGPSWLVLAILAVVPILGPIEGGGTKIAVLQTDATDIEAFKEFNLKAQQQGAHLVVWPELSAATLAYRGQTEELQRLSSEFADVAFVTTFEDDATPKPHNTAALFWQGKESVRYWKRRPFAGEAAKHLAGDLAVAVPWERLVGLNICFDSCYPGIMRDTVSQGDVQLIALPTLDPSSPDGVIQSLHAAFTPFRAAELGVSIARADTSAYSEIVDSYGRVQVQMGTEPGIAVAEIPSAHGTVYRRMGDWFLALCFIAVIISIVRSQIKQRSRLPGIKC